MSESSGKDKKTAILFFQLFTWLGGGEYGVFDLVRNLDRSRFSPVVMFNKRGPFVEKIEECGVEVVLMPYDVAPKLKLLHPASVWKNIRASLKIKRYIETRRIDIIHDPHHT